MQQVALWRNGSVGPDTARNERPLLIPFWALTFDELLPLTLGPIDDNARGRVIDWITTTKRESVASGAFPGIEPDWISVDTRAFNAGYGQRAGHRCVMRRSAQSDRFSKRRTTSSSRPRLQPARRKPRSCRF